MTAFRLFGPMLISHPAIGELCAACQEPFKEGDYTTLVPLGPGKDKDTQERAREGKSYNAVSAHVHYSCATGKEDS